LLAASITLIRRQLSCILSIAVSLVCQQMHHSIGCKDSKKNRNNFIAFFDLFAQLYCGLD
jgi:hypothetical protein